MSPRRLTGLLASAFMLHFTLVSGGLGCCIAKGSSGMAEASGAGHNAMPMGNGEAHHGAGHQSKAPGGTPSQTDCCQGVSSCANALDASVRVTRQPTPPNAARVAGSATANPASWITPTESPPPRS